MKKDKPARNSLQASNISIGNNLATLDKNPLEKLSDMDFPETIKDEGFGFYRWPYDPDLLTLLLRHQAHHESAVRCKTDTAALTYRPHVNNRCFEAWLNWKVINNAIQALLKQAKDQPDKTTTILQQIKEMQDAQESDREKLEQVREFYRFMPSETVISGIYDYNYLGNIFFRILYTPDKEIDRVRHLFGRTMRVRLENKGYIQFMNNMIKKQFSRNQVLHVKMYGPESSIYGSPSYLGSQNSNLLSHAYDLLFLKFVENGAHLGHIFLFNFDYDDRDEKGISAKETKIKEDIKAAKGIGNGQNWYFNLGGLTDEEGKPVEIEKVVKIIPLGELIAKLNMDIKASEYLRDNILSAHRIPGEILAVATEKKTGQDLNKLVDLYNKNTVFPIQSAVKESLNGVLPPDRWIDFDPYMVE